MSAAGDRAGGPAPAYVVVTDGPVGVGDEVQVCAVPADGPVVWEVGTVTEVDGERGEQSAAGGWDCEAYGPKGTEIGALCFIAGELGERVCRTAGECSDQTGSERRRVFRRINELAAAGDPDFAYLAGQFTSPDQLLGGAGERPPDAEGADHRFLSGGDDATFGTAGTWCAVWVRTADGPDQCGRPPEVHPPDGWGAVSLAEAMKKATEDPSCGVARLECAPDVVGFLRSLAPDVPPSPPWRPTPLAPLGSVPVVGVESMPAGRWRMVDRDGGVVWEGVDVDARAGDSR